MPDIQYLCVNLQIFTYFTTSTYVIKLTARLLKEKHNCHEGLNIERGEHGVFVQILMFHSLFAFSATCFTFNTTNYNTNISCIFGLGPESKN